MIFEADRAIAVQTEPLAQDCFGYRSSDSSSTLTIPSRDGLFQSWTDAPVRGKPPRAGRVHPQAILCRQDRAPVLCWLTPMRGSDAACARIETRNPRTVRSDLFATVRRRTRIVFRQASAVTFVRDPHMTLIDRQYRPSDRKFLFKPAEHKRRIGAWRRWNSATGGAINAPPYRVFTPRDADD